MERLGLLIDYEKVCQGLNVHKRAAANIKEQLSIISRNLKIRRSDLLEQALCKSLSTSIPKLRDLCQLPPLSSYLRQGEITDLLDSIFKSCWTFTQAYDDGLLREDIEAQREIYDSDRKADSVGLRRLLRECLRRKDIQQLIVDMTKRELLAIQSAVKVEMSMSAANPENISLYRDFLSYLEQESTQARKRRGLQDLTGKIVRISSAPIAWGVVCTVWTGELYGKKVTLHRPIPPTGDSPSRSIGADVLKNASVWASFDHPHILNLLGIYQDSDQRAIALVSPWMENQTAIDFMRNNPGADRLKLITEVASGLTYLHTRKPPYAHGLLSADCVLLNEEKKAVVGGFASATFSKGWMTPLRWLAPENTKRESFAATLASDTYSFAMTAFQIVTGKSPFEDVRSPVRLLKLLEKGGRPARPEHRLIHQGLDDKLWMLITRCWAQDPNARPSMTEVLQELQEMRQLPALDVRDLTSLIILAEGTGFNAIHAGGAFGDIRIATLSDSGQRVALKTLNIKSQVLPDHRLTKRFLREASIWNRLNHPNILPFLGTADPPGLSTCFVSPWMPNGNSIEYLMKHREISPISIGKGIAQGLAYLHAFKPKVIHGDLRAVNILISDAGEPLLCDFGLAVIVEELTHMPISSALEGCGNPRWMAPELLSEESIVSTESDVWALGMVLLEITALVIPFCELKSSAQVILHIDKGGRPVRPTERDVVDRGLNDNLWGFMERCWAQNPSERPLASEALAMLGELVPVGDAELSE